METLQTAGLPEAPSSAHGLTLDAIAQGLAHPGWVLCPNWLPPMAVADLRAHTEMLRQEGQLRPAEVGRGLHRVRNSEARSDFIRWVDDWSPLPALVLHQVKLADMLLVFREQLRIPIKRFEGMLACYPPGGRYVKHRDQHRQSRHRQITSVLYLNTLSDGGALRLYVNEQTVELQPTAGSIVFFRSSLLHEVVPTIEMRYTLTAWYRDDLLPW